MWICRLSFLLVLLVGVDFACPLLPGAVAFEIEQSIDASRRLSVPLDHAVATVRRAIGPARATVAKPHVLAPKPAVGAGPSNQAPRGRSSTFLPAEPSSSLLEDQ